MSKEYEDIFAAYLRKHGYTVTKDPEAMSLYDILDDLLDPWIGDMGQKHLAAEDLAKRLPQRVLLIEDQNRAIERMMARARQIDARSFGLLPWIMRYLLAAAREQP